MSSMTGEQRLWLLSEIKENYQLLCGALDNSQNITKETQSQGWKELYEQCKTYDLPFTRKSHSVGNAVYLRDQVWGKMRRDVLAKRDKCRKYVACTA